MKSKTLKIAVLVLILIFVAGGILLVHKQNKRTEVSGAEKYADYIFYRGDYNPKLKDNKYSGALSNTYSKLTNNKKLKVVYFGGSVTAGAGASDGKFCWRSMIGEWLINNFPEAEITNCNKALGETGTHLGVYRLDKAVIEEKPDLLFIEYSINDFYDKASFERASIQFETIVRKVREKLPECDIVTILVTDVYGAKSARNENPENALHIQAKAHEYISKEYNISSIHVGRALVNEFISPDWDGTQDEEWSTYVKDIVHPTDVGYKAYYEVIKEFLSNTLLCGNYGKCGIQKQRLPSLKSSDLLDGDLTFIDPDPDAKTSVKYPEEYSEFFTFLPENLGIVRCDNPEYIGVMKIAKSSDAYIEVEFSGTDLIMLAQGIGKTNQYEVSVDGGDWETKNYAGKNPVIIAEELESGKHTARIKTSLSGDVTISGFYSSDSTKATVQLDIEEF